MQIRTSHSLAGCLAAAALIASMATHAAPNVVNNGGFETGDFTGWTQFGNTTFSGVDGSNPQSGSFAAFFGPVGSTGGIFQTLATTPGATTIPSLRADERSRRGGNAAPNSFSFNWNGGAAEFSLTNAPASGYTNYSFLLPATGAATDLRFTFQHDPAFWDLDNVSAVPEPGSASLWWRWPAAWSRSRGGAAPPERRPPVVPAQSDLSAIRKIFRPGTAAAATRFRARSPPADVMASEKKAE